VHRRCHCSWISTEARIPRELTKSVEYVRQLSTLRVIGASRVASHSTVERFSVDGQGRSNQPPPRLRPQLTQYDDRGWRATFYTTGMEHSPTSATGTGWERTPWHATRRAAWEALKQVGSETLTSPR